MASIICRNGSAHRHESVFAVRECWNFGPVVGTPVELTKPEKETLSPVNDPFSIPTNADFAPARATLDAPKAERVNVTEGFWVVGSGESAEYFKIQLSGRSEKLYGKKLEGESFEYFKSAPRYVETHGGRKLTADDAKWFGKLYGRCMICGRTLENEESIAEGIGPICAGKL